MLSHDEYKQANLEQKKKKKHKSRSKLKDLSFLFSNIIFFRITTRNIISSVSSKWMN